MIPALCQCVRCLRYLAINRAPTGEQHCLTCAAEGAGGACRLGGLPLASIRLCVTEPRDVEVLGLMTEEAGEISQRVGKILRWGWAADFEGTTQRHKLEVELADAIAVMLIADHEKLVSMEAIGRLVAAKLDKFREDAAGPRQRLQVASVPEPLDAAIVMEGVQDALDAAARRAIGGRR